MGLSQCIHCSIGRVPLSYLFDWIVIVVFIAVAGALSFVTPKKRDFSLTDDSISFPYRTDTISVALLFIIAVVVPAVIIAAVCAAVIRMPTRPGSWPSRTAVSKGKLWELHASWLGLALSITLSLILTQAMKNMFGKHRPDFLSRCDPDISKLSTYTVGGFASESLEGTSQLVTWEICQSKDGLGVGKAEFLDGFRSFPSGHCTIAFSGLIYLSLFIAARLSVTMPFLAPSTEGSSKARKLAAAPPLYLLVLVLIPVFGAIYIASTRYTDGKHEGFDVLFGSLEGIICAWFAFRWYHLPIRRGSGWAWAPRDSSVAFGLGYLQHEKSRELGVQCDDTTVYPAEIELHNVERVTTSERGLRMQEP